MMKKPPTGTTVPGGALASDAIKVTELVLARIAEDEEILHLLQHERASLTGKMSDRQLDTLMESTRAAKAIADGWRAEGRQVLAMHPDLMAELSVASSDKIVGEVFRTLPYINGLVIFGDPPIVFKTSDHKDVDAPEQFQMLGYLTYGKTMFGQLTTTHDPAADLLGIMFVLAILDDSGKVIDWEFDKVSLPFYGEGQTIKEWGAGLSHRFQWSSQMYGKKNTQEKVGTEFLSSMLTYVVASLSYLSSTVLDVEKMPNKAAAKIAKGVERKPIRFNKVGWKLGPALTKQRKANDRERQTGNGVPIMMPHQRRAHFAIRWTGKGRAVPRLVFVAPTWINRHLLDEDGIRTVHPVPAPKP